jgi:hypothetical protein
MSAFDLPAKKTSDPDAIRCNMLHAFVSQRGFETVKAMIECGKILTHKKHSMKRGQWLPWVKSDLDFTERSAQYYMLLYRHRDKLLNEQPESLTMAIALLADTKRITPGLLSGDEKILRRNIVTPVKVVRKRLRKLPTDPLHYETVLKIVTELQEEIAALLEDLR